MHRPLIFKCTINFILPLILSLFLLNHCFAQDRTLKGRVVDNSGRAIPNSTITILPGSNKLQTDEEGLFQTIAPQGKFTITVSSIGFKSNNFQFASTDTIMNWLEVILENESNLQEVVVSATRSKETLDQVPSSVKILSSKDIETQKSINNNLTDILAYSVPGMAFSSNRTQNLGQTMRGRNVLIMIDGIPQSTPLRVGARDIRSIDPSVIERIEVIKGATAIYGNGADGGLINYITKSATKGKRINGETTLGSNISLVKPEQTSGTVFSQSLNGQLGKLDYVVAGRFEQTGLYRDAHGTPLSPEYGLNDLRMWNAYLKTGYNFDKKNRLEVMYNFFSSKQYTDYIAKPGVYGNPDSATIGIPGNRPGRPEGVPYNHNLNARFTSSKIIGKTDLDVNIYLQDFLTRISYSNFFEGNGQPETPDTKKGLRVNFNTPFLLTPSWYGNITYGLDALADKTSTVLADGRISVPKMDMKSLAPYLQVQSIFFENLILKAGTRFEDINIQVPDYRTLPSLNSVTGQYGGGNVNVKGGKLSYNTVVFNAGLRFNKYRFFRPFVSYSQSFSIADLGLALRSASENTLQNITTKAVKANNYEFGFNSNLGKLNIEGAVYLSKSLLGASYIFVDGHAQVARSPENIHGFEIAMDYSVTNKLQLGGSYSYTEGKRKMNDGTSVYLGGDRINPPKTTAYISYNFIPQWLLRLQMIHSGNRKRFEPINDKYTYAQGPINSFTTFGASSAINIGQKNTLRIGIENLFNQDYFTIISQWQADRFNYVKANGTRANISFSRSF